ncbi:MAG: nitroreductase family protein, partial [Candidatus Tectomicrobia bacterium]|nr:nitroreductase family protein [Candidatus Tectomicrobia bacterium]
AMEEAVFERRSVRNFLDKPVPDALIRRVLEAGRFAPSAGNCQPWKFIVVTDKKHLAEMSLAIRGVLKAIWNMYNDDQAVKNLVPMYEADPTPGLYDPRAIQVAVGCAGLGILPIFLNAPAVILMACDDRAIGGPQLAAGICRQNMNLVANSLGIKSCWVGLSVVIERVPPSRRNWGSKTLGKSLAPWLWAIPNLSRKALSPGSSVPSPGFARGPMDLKLRNSLFLCVLYRIRLKTLAFRQRL